MNFLHLFTSLVDIFGDAKSKQNNLTNPKSNPGPHLF
jgi:hypothetical protein